MRVGRAGQGSTRPPKNNERGLRELTTEEIPPNLNFYAMDPLYNPDAVLGWAEERIEEKLNRGMLALSMEGGKFSMETPQGLMEGTMDQVRSDERVIDAYFGGEVA